MSIASERHYRIQELVKLWGYGRTTLTTIFTREPSVLKLGKGRRVTLSIPESVALRVHEQLSQAAAPRTVIHLRDLRPPRKVIKLQEYRKLLADLRTNRPAQ